MDQNESEPKLNTDRCLPGKVHILLLLTDLQYLIIFLGKQKTVWNILVVFMQIIHSQTLQSTCERKNKQKKRPQVQFCELKNTVQRQTLHSRALNLLVHVRGKHSQHLTDEQNSHARSQTLKTHTLKSRNRIEGIFGLQSDVRPVVPSLSEAERSRRRKRSQAQMADCTTRASASHRHRQGHLCSSSDN